MKLNIYAIYDSAIGAYMQPWQARTDEEALRGFAAAANDPTHAIGQSPKDFTLFRVGTWDQDTADINQDNRAALARAHEQVLQRQHDNQTSLFDPEGHNYLHPRPNFYGEGDKT